MNEPLARAEYHRIRLSGRSHDSTPLHEPIRADWAQMSAEPDPDAKIFRFAHW